MICWPEKIYCGSSYVLQTKTGKLASLFIATKRPERANAINVIYLSIRQFALRYWLVCILANKSNYIRIS